MGARQGHALTLVAPDNAFCFGGHNSSLGRKKASMQRGQNRAKMDRRLVSKARNTASDTLQREQVTANDDTHTR